MRQVLRECDETITLADGRTLGFAQYGDPTGFPVLYFHGGLSCRIDATSAGPAAAAAGLRIIAPDRPGVGLSGRHQGASLLDWPRDVAGLTHQLDIEEFVVMGWSFGGAYAAACGFALPDQVTTTVLIASGIPRDWPGMIEQINGMDRVFLKLSGRSGAVDEAAFVAIRTLAKRTPNLFVADREQDVRSVSQRHPARSSRIC